MNYMTDIQASLLGLVDFASYFAVSIVLLLVFKVVYTLITPQDEWKLVKDEKNTAAAIGFMGAVLGFALALASAASNSESLIDFIIWGIVALIAQTIAFAIVRFIFMPKVVQRINDNEVSAGIVLGGTSIAVGLLNAACMTY
ncbi:MAG: putative membrane protein [Oceanospirillaceae bacterium]|jgi:putative membrane protein